MTNSEAQILVDQKASELAEHFDPVRIFVTRHNGGDEKTQSIERGKGNFYAQFGQITEWLSIQDQFQRNYAVRKDSEDKD